MTVFKFRTSKTSIKREFQSILAFGARNRVTCELRRYCSDILRITVIQSQGSYSNSKMQERVYKLLIFKIFVSRYRHRITCVGPVVQVD